jgi:hypothetical protein
LFNVFDEPGVPAGPKLLPVVPWLFALLAFALGAPPVPFTVTPLLNVVPVPDDGEPPDEALGEAPVEAPAAPLDEPPPLPLAPPPLPAARADRGDSKHATISSCRESERDMAKTPFSSQRRSERACSCRS